MSDRVDLPVLFERLDRLLAEEQYAELSTFVKELDHAIKLAISLGELDRQGAEEILRTLQGKIEACTALKQQTVKEAVALNKGTAGVKAYKNT